MIDDDLIRDNPIAKQGLILLVQSGILDLQSARLTEQLASGDVNESDEVLIKRIKEYRLNRNLVESLLELGRGFVQEENNRE